MAISKQLLIPAIGASKFSSETVQRIVWYIFILALVSLVLGFAGFALETITIAPTTISGVVVDEQDNPVANAGVSVDGIPGISIKTQPNGNFEVIIPATKKKDTYTVRASKDTLTGKAIVHELSSTVTVKLSDKGKILQAFQGVLTEATTELRLKGEEWAKDSRVRLNEPSGLTSTGLVNSGKPIALAVDDEENGVFALQALGDLWLVIVHFISFDKVYDDFESICYDREQDYYYALTSHRRRGIERESSLVKFRLNQADWNEINKVSTTSMSLSSEMLEAISQAEKLEPLQASEWGRKYEDDPHPYKLEIEGLTWYENGLLMGLKWPLDNDDRA